MRGSFITLIVLTLLMFTASAFAEPLEVYTGLYGGGGFPADFSNVKVAGIEVNDLALENAYIVGAKLGAYEGIIGTELEVYWGNPHLKQQDVTGCLGGTCATVNTPGAHIRLIAGAMNFLLRYPTRGTWYPYIGLGFAIAHAHGSDATGTDSDISPGLNFLVGARGLITDRIGLFGEFKFLHTKFEFEDSLLEGTLNIPMIAGGISMNF